MSASENQLGGGTNESYFQFKDKLSRVGLSGVNELLPIAYWDIFYWDYALWANDEMEILNDKIRNALFPDFPPEAPTDEKELRAWRNKLCDILVAWAHAYHKWDVLVTRDNNFHEKKKGLRE